MSETKQKSLAEQLAEKYVTLMGHTFSDLNGFFELLEYEAAKHQMTCAIDEALEAAAQECDKVQARKPRIPLIPDDAEDGAAGAAEELGIRIRALKSQPVPISGDPGKTGTKP